MVCSMMDDYILVWEDMQTEAGLGSSSPSEEEDEDE